MSEKAR